MLVSFRVSMKVWGVVLHEARRVENKNFAVLRFDEVPMIICSFLLNYQ